MDFLKDGPKQRKEIVKQLCPKIMSEKKVQTTLNELDDAGRIKTVSRKEEGSHRRTTWYALPEHEYLLETDAGRVVTAIERLRSILLRPPLIHEIAVEAGITPEMAEKWVYKLAPQTGWFNPSPEIVEESKAIRGEALVCAARIKAGKVREDGASDVFNYEDDKEIVELAKGYLKEHPELLPKLTPDGRFISWPKEAQKYVENYKPKYRGEDADAFAFGTWADDPRQRQRRWRPFASR